MYSLRKALGGAAIAVLAFAAVGSSASASPITYTEKVTATGSLGGVAFTNASMVLTMNADTTTVYGGGTANLGNDGTLKIYVGSASPVTLLAAAFFNSTVSGFGFIPGPDLVDVVTPALAGYDLTTLIGPVTGDGLFNPGHNFTTSGGTLRIDALNSPVTFAATATPYVPGGTVPGNVPEPLTLSLFAAGLAGFAGMRRKAL